MADNENETWENAVGWSYDEPPVEGAFLTDRGWEIHQKGTDPADGLTEVIVAIPRAVSDANKAAEANIVGIEIVGGDAYAQGDTLQVLVLFNELVDVTAGATLEITTTGGSGNWNVTAAAQTGVNEVLFEGVIPSETAVLSIAAQTISGTVVDADDATASDLTVSADVASAAGVVNIA